MKKLKAKLSYFYIGASLIAIVLLLGTIALNVQKLQASNLIQVDKDRFLSSNPNESGEFWDFILVPLLTVPNEYYTSYQPGTKLSSSLDFPIARMTATREANVGQTSVYLADSSGFENVDDIGFRILSSIRYELNDGSIVYVSSTLPSPAAMDSVLSFGGNVIVLKTQGEAWLDTNVNLDETSSNINFIKDDLIITVAGNVDPEELASIADELVYE